MPQKRTVTATIALNASLSGAVHLGSGVLTGIVMPAAWTAAGLTFQVSADGTTYNNLYDEFGGEVAVTVDASRFVRLNPSEWLGVQYVKIRSGTAALAVNQAAARTLLLEIWQEN